MRHVEGSEPREKHESEGRILLKVFLQRHGPKLSASGEKNEMALYFGSSVEQGFEEMGINEGAGLVHVSSSPIKRALDTANIDFKKLSETGHRISERIGKQEKLVVPFQPVTGEVDEDKKRYAHDLEVIVGMQRNIEPEIRDQIEGMFPHVETEVKEAKIRNLIDMRVLSVMFNEEEAKRQGIETSYEELADNLAKRYGGFLRHMGLLSRSIEESQFQPHDEPYVQIDISHSFPIMSFLKKYLVFSDGSSAKDLSPQEFFDRTGGVIKESDSLELDYESAGDGYVVKVKGSFVVGKNFSGQLDLGK
jgi:hypothetical protein